MSLALIIIISSHAICMRNLFKFGADTTSPMTKTNTRSSLIHMQAIKMPTVKVYHKHKLTPVCGQCVVHYHTLPYNTFEPAEKYSLEKDR